MRPILRVVLIDVAVIVILLVEGLAVKYSKLQQDMWSHSLFKNLRRPFVP
jgi:hypothetical protein